MMKAWHAFVAILASYLIASYADAQEWNTSIGVSVYDRYGSIQFNTNNYPRYEYRQPNVVYVQPPVVYQQPQQVIVVPCYNCNSPRYNPYADPYRNHKHLQRGYQGQPNVNIHIHN